MEKILNAGLMSECDKYTIDAGMPSLVLMERAALSVKSVIDDNNLDTANVLILCGTGNNAADGIALARLLCDEGSSVAVCLLGDKEKYSDELNTQLRIIKHYNISFTDEIEPDKYDMIVDAIFGIGIKRNVEGDYAEAINIVNESSAPIVSIDIPSGLSSDTGLILGTAIRADITVTFQYAKKGQLICEGPALCGELYVENIGIFSDIADAKCDTYIITSDDLELLPPRNEAGNKGDFGKLLVIAGSKDICGAAYLASSAAMKCGIGMVKIFTAKENRTALSVLIPEALISTYGDSSKDLDKLQEDIEWADAVVIGPGIGTDAQSKKLLKKFLKFNKLPTVMDADALNIISGDESLWELINASKCVITPHVKEMSRLMGVPVSDIKNDPINTASDFANKHNVTCVLKDAKTVIAYPKGYSFINTSGCSALATAGSGDVLSGIIGSFIARYKNIDLPLSAMAVYIHGLAGEINAENCGEDAVTASSLFKYIKIN